MCSACETSVVSKHTQSGRVCTCACVCLCVPVCDAGASVEQFEQAKNKLSSLQKDPGNKVKLKIYALFKQVSCGRGHSTCHMFTTRLFQAVLNILTVQHVTGCDAEVTGQGDSSATRHTSLNSTDMKLKTVKMFFCSSRFSLFIFFYKQKMFRLDF